MDYVFLEWYVAKYTFRNRSAVLVVFFKATIGHLRARKQRYKLKMFQRLHLVLLFAVLVVIAFFVVSSMSFSGRLAEGSWLLFLFSFLLFSSYILQIMLRRHGAFDGGFWTAG